MVSGGDAVGTTERIEEAVQMLQQLGLKEYEALCFVGLQQIETGTARKLSEITDVPRTRVYDSIRVLEAQGLVHIHHSSPQHFRAVPLGEAVETLRDQYEDRIDQLHTTLDVISVVADEKKSSQQVWGMAGNKAIENQTEALIETASDEIVLVLGDEALLTDDLIITLNAVEDDSELLIGTLTPALEDRVQSTVSGATTFVSGLEWLRNDDSITDETAVGRLLLVDRSKILVSSIIPATGVEQAVFGTGFGNGLVVIARRIMAHGLLPQD